MTKKELDVIQEKIGYKFKESDLLIQAFTRKSFSAENQGWEHNETLEFVGDKVLDLIVVKKLTNMYSFTAEATVQSLSSIKKGEKANEKNLEEKTNVEFVLTEGELTEIKKQLVQTSFLSRAIERLELEKFLLMSKGDTINNVQNEPHVKEDLLEAIIGAIAIDCGWNMETLELVADKLLNLDFYIQNGTEEEIDYISYIHNWYQKEYKKEPEYIFAYTGSDDIFDCYLEFPGYSDALFSGFGYSKKEATRLAAKRGYDYLQKKQSISNGIFQAIGDFDLESAINKLQMLQDKKLISGLRYEETENEPSADSNGNPTWSVRCVVDGIDDYVCYTDTKKKQARKAAAFTMLQLITGRDRVEEFLKEQKMRTILELF